MVVVKEKCWICGNIEEFCTDDDATLKREAKCSFCGAALRNSDVSEEIIKHISDERCLGSFQFLAITDKAAINIVEQVSFWEGILGYMNRSGVDGS